MEMFMNELTAVLQDGANAEAILAVLASVAAVAVVAGIISLVFLLIKVITRWKIFTKAGEKGWKALIPVYNTYTEFSFTWKGVYAIAMLAALVIARVITSFVDPDTLIYGLGSLFALFALVVGLIQTHKLSASFGHGVGFTLGLIFLNPIFMLILAFGKNSQYVGPIVKNR